MAETFPGWESAGSCYAAPQGTRAGRLERGSPTRVPEQESAGVIEAIASTSSAQSNLIRGSNHINDGI